MLFWANLRKFSKKGTPNGVVFKRKRHFAWMSQFIGLPTYYKNSVETFNLFQCQSEWTPILEWKRRHCASKSRLLVRFFSPFDSNIKSIKNKLFLIW